MEPWDYLPNPWREAIFQLSSDKLDNLEEVRFRLDRPVYCYGPYWVEPLKVGDQILIGVQSDLDHIVGVIAQHSLYARTEELRHGYLTLPGGHRVGIAGKAIWENGKIVTMGDVTGLNFRKARHVEGIADALHSIFSRHQLDLESFLIAGPPRSGKTTLLRDCARFFSAHGERVTIVDERSELAGYHDGHYGFALGLHLDVLDGWPKAEGLNVAIRTLGPDRVIVDEIGSREDLQAVSHALHAGVKVVASIHAQTYDDLRHRGQGELSLENLFDAVVFLHKGEMPGMIHEIWHHHEKVWKVPS